MKLLRAVATLVLLAFRRLLWSTNTLMVLFPLALCVLFVYDREYGALYQTHPVDAFRQFTDDVVLHMFAGFVIPICALAFGTTSIGADREEHTLLFLLVRPIPRGVVFLSKFAASLPLAAGLALTAFGICCGLAGPPGREAFELFLPAVFYLALAYTAVFQLFSVVFRHGTIVALVYALFMETLLGNMPGIVKRVAINFYGRSMVFELGAHEGLKLDDPDLFVPVTAAAAAATLLIVTAAALAAGLAVFQFREYRDLS